MRYYSHDRQEHGTSRKTADIPNKVLKTTGKLHFLKNTALSDKILLSILK